MLVNGSKSQQTVFTEPICVLWDWSQIGISVFMVWHRRGLQRSPTWVFSDNLPKLVSWAAWPWWLSLDPFCSFSTNWTIFLFYLGSGDVGYNPMGLKFLDNIKHIGPRNIKLFGSGLVAFTLTMLGGHLLFNPVRHTMTYKKSILLSLNWLNESF